jgi:hypothetical protein
MDETMEDAAELLYRSIKEYLKAVGNDEQRLSALTYLFTSYFGKIAMMGKERADAQLASSLFYLVDHLALVDLLKSAQKSYDDKANRKAS